MDAFASLMSRLFEKFEPHHFSHVILAKKYKEALMCAISKRSTKIQPLPFECDCNTNEGGEEHCHLILHYSFECHELLSQSKILRAKENLRKAVNKILNEEKQRGQRCMYQKTINSPVHLINTVLYIQTKQTKGYHTGRLKECGHFNHSYQDLKFENKTDCKFFKETFLYRYIPCFKEEQLKEWNDLTAERKKKKILYFEI